MDRNPLLKKERLALAGLFILGLFMISCSSQKKMGGLLPQVDSHQVELALWKEICKTNAIPNDFSANFTLSFQGEEIEKTGIPGRFSGQIKMIKDSVLWLSAGMLGIEGLRIWIKTDSVFILNRLNKECHIYALSNLRQQYPLLAPYVSMGFEWAVAIFTRSLPFSCAAWDMSVLANSPENSLILERKTDQDSDRIRFVVDKQSLLIIGVLSPIKEGGSLEWRYKEPWEWELKAMEGAGLVQANGVYTKVRRNEGVSVLVNLPDNYKKYEH